ncbi:hypothetical protein FHU34_112423 [Micromonospora taraxaci]|uniref:Uncharacterized protein n=1 Tax=Micromonospora taraxaci TaxID=1316803 RepID=A0A561VZR6_9ACTN|nr:hypothetical protein FHU34_112423 [Micromonospora taraxaci]
MRWRQVVAPLNWLNVWPAVPTEAAASGRMSA